MTLNVHVEIVAVYFLDRCEFLPFAEDLCQRVVYEYRVRNGQTTIL
jgi:hypothetical protein